MQPIQLGIIGTGKRGRMFRGAHEQGDLRVVACCDPEPVALDTAREVYGNDIFTASNVGELLSQPLDAVAVCSPDYLHEDHACAALATGRAVYLEKPMHITTEGCDHILRTARKNDATLFVGHNMRYMVLFRKMKQLIDEGVIGELRGIWCRHFVAYGGDAYFRDWHSERRFSNGLLLTKGVHDIDVIHWLAGAYSRRVTAFGSLSVYNQCERRAPDEAGEARWNDAHWPPLEQTGFSPAIDVEDHSMVLMDLGEGRLASYQQCHFTPDACRNYTVIGTEGRLENMGDDPDAPIYFWNSRQLEYGSPRRMLEPDAVFHADPVAEGGHGGADPLIVKEFVELVRGKCRDTTASPEAARMAVATACAATDSLRDGGRPVVVPRGAA